MTERTVSPSSVQVGCRTVSAARPTIVRFDAQSWDGQPIESRLGALDEWLRRITAPGGESELAWRTLEWIWGASAFPAETCRNARIGSGPDFAEYQPGDSISVGAGGDGLRYLSWGWAAAEPWGVWSDGEEARITLSFREPPRGRVTLQAKFQTFRDAMKKYAKGSDWQEGSGSFAWDGLEALHTALKDVGASPTRQDVMTALGTIQNNAQQLTIQANTQLANAAQFANTIVTTRSGKPVRLGDVAKVIDSVENTQTRSQYDGIPAIVLAVQRQPDANTVEVVDKVKAMLPSFEDQMPAAASIKLLNDRSTSVRQAVNSAGQRRSISSGVSPAQAPSSPSVRSSTTVTAARARQPMGFAVARQRSGSGKGPTPV